jgi:hypothetical protein
MATQIKLRRDTAANWLLEDPVLGAGEPGFELVTGKLKIGDGTSLWSALDYIVAEPDGSIDLGAVDKNLLPATDNAYDLGSPAKRWRHLYAAGGSVYVGDIKLSNSSGTLVVQQVTNAGLINEAPVAGPGVVTTDRISNGIHSFSINSSGVLQLDGSPYLGGDTALPTNTLGYLYNDGTGTLTWASGAGGGGGGSSDRLTNGLNEVILDATGVLVYPNGALQRDTGVINCAGNASTMVYTASGQYQHTIKLLIQVEGNVGAAVDWDTQSCEMIIAKSWRANDVAASVYAVVHTSVAPLATFTAEWNALTERVDVVCATPSANSVYVKTFATEITTAD